MSVILDAVIAKIQLLDKKRPPEVELGFDYGSTGYAKVPVPNTAEGRRLLRLLLVEVGRHECELEDNKHAVFGRVRDGASE